VLVDVFITTERCY